MSTTTKLKTNRVVDDPNEHACDGAVKNEEKNAKKRN